MRRRWTHRSCTSSLLVRRSRQHLQGHHHSVLQRVALLHVRAGCGLLNARVRTSKSTTARVTQSHQPRARLSSESCETLRAGRTQRSTRKGNAVKVHGQTIIRTHAGSALTCSLLHNTKRQGNHTNKKATSSIRLLPYTLPSPQSIPDLKVPHLELRIANTQR